MSVSPYITAMIAASTRNSSEKLWSYYKQRTVAKVQNARLRNEVAMAHINLVREIAHRMKSRCTESYEDLEQIGLCGALKAIEKFDPTKGIAFSSFAVPYIRGEILHFLRDHGTGIKVPRRWRELHASANNVERVWSEHKGKLPNDQELADEMGVRVAKLREVRTAITNQHAMSLDHRGLDFAAPESFAVQQESIGKLEAAWSQLRQRLGKVSNSEQQLIQGVYFARQSRKPSAQQLHLEPTMVRSTLHQALSQLAG
jgi:RNA polymerase sigma-B factor